MVGKGSIKHNERKFTAENVDKERTKNNVVFIQDNLKQVYHELFDDAQERYNAKQERKDRKITNYYEHVRSGKQEKLFHEVIFQIGNKDDMAVGSAEGELAKKILCEFMESFQERNPNLRVFSAHLHMDEATPHLHIDFVPFTTGSKRGLDTRVSMKQALMAQGFKGKGRSDTEYNRWINAEKKALSKTMERHGIEWNQLGTHKEHLSVLDYKREERSKEVAELQNTIRGKQKAIITIEDSLHDKTLQVMELEEKLDTTSRHIDELEKERKKAEQDTKKYKKRLQEIAPMIDKVQNYAIEYSENIDRVLPEAGGFESGKTYREKKAKPLLKKLVDLVRSLYSAFLDMKNKYDKLLWNYSYLSEKNEQLNMRVYDLVEENDSLKKVSVNYERVKRVYGTENVELAVERAKEQEQIQATQRKTMKRGWDKGAR